jgi:mannose-6-phosphate isomerase-like protein (cupin superfamily)
MILSGDLELKMEGQSIQPSVGEEICIPAGMTHTIRNIGGKTARWLYGIQREATDSSPAPYSLREMTHATS